MRYDDDDDDDDEPEMKVVVKKWRSRLSFFILFVCPQIACKIDALKKWIVMTWNVILIQKLRGDLIWYKVFWNVSPFLSLHFWKRQTQKNLGWVVSSLIVRIALFSFNVQPLYGFGAPIVWEYLNA